MMMMMVIQIIAINPGNLITFSEVSILGMSSGISSCRPLVVFVVLLSYMEHKFKKCIVKIIPLTFISKSLLSLERRSFVQA